MDNMDSLPSCKYLSLNFYASEGEGAYSKKAHICYFGGRGGRLFKRGHLERGRLFEEIRYILMQPQFRLIKLFLPISFS